MKAISKQSTHISVTFTGAILFCMSLFSTAPILCLHVGGSYLSLFSVFFVFALVILAFNVVFKNVIIKLQRNTILLLVWLTGSIVSALFGCMYFTEQLAWRDTALLTIPKVIGFIMFVLLFALQPNKRELVSILVKGLIFGCFCNIVWTIIDGSCYYLFGFSLTNELFHDYAVDNNIRYETISIIVGGLIRSGGFNFDPAHMGFIIPAMVAYSMRKKKILLFLMSMLAIVFSASTTAAVCSVIVILINVNWRLLFSKKRKISAPKVIAGLILFITALVLIIWLLAPALEKFYNRVAEVYLHPSDDNPRVIYWKYFFQAVLNAGPMILVGTGFKTASYAYVFDNNILGILGASNYFPYDMEMNYIAYVFDLGIAGCALYLYFLYCIFRNTRKNQTDTGIGIYSLICGMIFSALFYHYTLMAMQVIILIVGLVFAEEGCGSRCRLGGVNEKISCNNCGI